MVFEPVYSRLKRSGRDTVCDLLHYHCFKASKQSNQSSYGCENDSLLSDEDDQQCTYKISVTLWNQRLQPTMIKHLL